MKKVYEMPSAELCRIKMSDIMIFESSDPEDSDREFTKLY